MFRMLVRGISWLDIFGAVDNNGAFRRGDSCVVGGDGSE
jgi:hypothetical protein